MCGIAGTFALRETMPTDNKQTLACMLQTLKTRGPDASGMWTARLPLVSFGHRRLSIIDVDSRSDQPMHSADGRYTIVFNGEIYNYRALRRELEQKGRTFVTEGDTEVLLQMFAEYGIAMLTRLRGMFAFGIWDEHEQKLVLARDPFGIKPLYYAAAQGQFYFASQVKALLNVPGVDQREEPAGHVGFFLLGSVPEPYTLYRGIHCLPSGSCLSLTRDGASWSKQFASPVDESACFQQADMPQTETECRTRLLAALEESVRMHETSDVPVAIFLSAGIDSGVIASLASESSNKFETLTLGFDLLRGTPNDETSLAKQVAEAYGLPNTSRYVDKSLFSSHRDRLLQHMDQPTIDGVNVYFISWLAKECGFKVALSGLGGDELFGGYPSFRQIPRTVAGLSPLRQIPGFGKMFRIITASAIRRFTSPKYAGLFEYGGSWGGAYLLRRSLFMPWELPEFLDPELVREGWRDLHAIERMNGLVEPLNHLHGVSKEQSDFLRVSALEMSYYMRNQLLRDADWAGMAHSVEIRVPFVDMELLKQISPLRASQYSPRKPGFAQVLRKPLPPEILNRPKTGFTVPVREWLQEKPQRGLREWSRYVYAALFAGAAVSEGAAHEHRKVA